MTAIFLIEKELNANCIGVLPGYYMNEHAAQEDADRMNNKNTQEGVEYIVKRHTAV